MSGKPVHAEGIRIWSLLPLADRFAIARRIVLRRTRAWRAKFPGLVSVGVGYRVRRESGSRGKARASKPGTGVKKTRIDTLRTLHRDVICVRFVVKSKWRSDRADDERRIPDCIPARATFRKRRRRVWIPTDVDQDGPGKLQASLDATDGIRVIEIVGGGVAPKRCVGSFCCVVRDTHAPSDRYLLSCHHVLTLSGQSHPGFQPSGAAGVRIRVPDQSIGSLYDYATLGNGTTYGCDAALAKLSTPDEPYVWGITPTRVAGPFAQPTSFRVFVPRRNQRSGIRIGPIPATFIDEQMDYTIQFSVTRSVRFKSVFRYAAETVDGDSGSALLGPDGTLFGMHFYKARNGVCCAIPAYILFTPGLFSIDVKL